MTNERIHEVSRETLEQEYEMSQWALAHALHRLGGRMTITEYDMLQLDGARRIWYSRVHTDAGASVVHVEVKPHGTVKIEV